MPAQTPAQLVDEFKKSGEFDRLRRDLLNSFRNGGGMNTLVTRVEELTKNKLSSEPQLQHMAEAQTVRELMQELERYPLIERAVADVPALVDPSFAASLRRSIEIVLYDDQRDGKLSNRVSSGAAAGALGTALTERTQIGHLLQVQKDPVAENGDSNVSVDDPLPTMPSLEANIRTPDLADVESVEPVPQHPQVNTVQVSNGPMNGGQEDSAAPDSPDTSSAMVESPLSDNGNRVLEIM